MTSPISTTTRQPHGGQSAAAVAAARRGWHVFPCRQGDKRPAIDRWEERASASPEHVEAAWRDRWPRANIGVACGPSGLVVIDLDTPEHGGQLPDSWRAEPGIRDGRDVLATLAERAGQPWPATCGVLTPRGGLHLYFAAIPGRQIRNSAGKIGPMIDARGAGGYVIGAGSIIGGRLYEVVSDGAVEPLPLWLTDLADPPHPARPRAAGADGPDLPSSGRYADRAIIGEIQRVLDAQPGQRNATLNRAAHSLGQLVAGGVLDEHAVRQALATAAERIGLGEREIRATIASGMTSGAKHPRGA